MSSIQNKREKKLLEFLDCFSTKFFMNISQQQENRCVSVVGQDFVLRVLSREMVLFVDYPF